MSILLVGGRRTLVLAFICTFVSAVFCFLVLSPSIGFDDANITLNYAKNIASGHGYVYNIGSERVEGSTSPAWTAINTVAYLLPLAPEVSLAGLGFLIAWTTVWLSMQYGEAAFRIAGQRAGVASVLVGVGFLALPSYFGWAIWSLMDFGLWVLLITATFWLSSAFVLGEGSRTRLILLALVAACMATTRPEGIAVVCGFAALLTLLKTTGRHSSWPAITMLVAGVLAYGALGLVRLTYFGDLLPNTYYSKVSTDRITQFIQGACYLRDFIVSPLQAAILLLAFILPVFVWRSTRWPRIRLFWGFTVLATFGGMMLYVAVGGDHFGSFRFFLFVYPAFLPLVALTVYLLWRKLPLGMRPSLGPALIASTLVILTSTVFAEHKGGYARELRIAEQGRRMGDILNTYPGQPTIGIIAAGGVAMTYDGHIYDLMGLNWVEMAHADRNLAGPYINHGGFSRTVFYKTLPEIVHPQFGGCDKQGYDDNRFFGRVLRWLVRDEAFQELYEFECFEGLRFYRLRNAGRVNLAGDIPPSSSTPARLWAKRE